MSWEIYRESAQALADVQLNLTSASRRVEARSAARLQQLAAERAQSAAVVAADRARLQAVRAELDTAGPHGTGPDGLAPQDTGPAAPPVSPRSVAEWRSRLGRLEPDVAESVVLAASLERSLRRLQAKPPAAEPPTVVPPQIVPQHGHRRVPILVTGLVILLVAVVLVVVLIVVRQGA